MLKQECILYNVSYLRNGVITSYLSHILCHN